MAVSQLCSVCCVPVLVRCQWVWSRNLLLHYCSFFLDRIKVGVVESLSLFCPTMSDQKRSRKCPRGFLGTPYRRKDSVEPTPVEKEATPPSVSKLKLSGDSLGFVSGCSTTVLHPRGSKHSPKLPNSSSETSRMDTPNSTNCIFSIGLFNGTLEKLFHCPGLPSTASEDSSVRQGLVSRITVSCPCGWFQHATDPYNADHLSVNTRVVLAMRMIGRGSSLLVTVCAMFDFPGALSSAACQNYTSDLYVASNDAVLAEQLASTGELRIKHAAGNLFIPPPIDSENDTSDEASGSDRGEPSEEAEQSVQYVSSDSESSSSDSGDDPVSDMADSDASLGSHDDQDGSVNRVGDGIPPNVWTNDPLDITLTFDGTWSKRGYTALYGVCCDVLGYGPCFGCCCAKQALWSMHSQTPSFTPH